MGRGDKFAGLIMYFSELKDNEVSLTFEQIESIVGERLCYSAYNHKEYWYVTIHILFLIAGLITGIR